MSCLRKHNSTQFSDISLTSDKMGIAIAIVGKIIKYIMNIQQYICPKCGSDHTKSLSAIRQEGVTTGVATAWVKGEYIRQNIRVVSEAAKKAAPPQKENLVVGFISDTIVWWLIKDHMWLKYWMMLTVSSVMSAIIPGSGTVAFLALLIWRFLGYIPYIQESTKFTHRVNEKLGERRETWNHTYACQRCDHNFVVEPTAWNSNTDPLPINNRW